MTISIDPVSPSFVAKVSGVDLTEPLSDTDFAVIEDAFARFAVLEFSGQPLDDDQQVSFSERFGPLERMITGALGGTAEVANLSNIDKDGELLDTKDARALILEGNREWHSDSSFKVVPALASALSARKVPPEGGETEYADMRAAYDALPDALKAELEGLEAEHSYNYSQGKFSLDAMTGEEQAALPPVVHPLIRVHPETGRKALYIGRHASHILGRPVEEGRALLAELLEHATQPQFTYSHAWQVGDLVMWDNRMVLHRGRAWDDTRYKRIMHRTTIAGKAAENPWVIDQAAAG
jgi:alpha-ketoglutarate-dependent 2,4-dichlorophenoxyacetate dioxygenase